MIGVTNQHNVSVLKQPPRTNPTILSAGSSVPCAGDLATYLSNIHFFACLQGRRCHNSPGTFKIVCGHKIRYPACIFACHYRMDGKKIKHLSCERMENIYLPIIQLWLFIQALVTEREKDVLMT